MARRRPSECSEATRRRSTRCSLATVNVLGGTAWLWARAGVRQGRGRALRRRGRPDVAGQRRWPCRRRPKSLVLLGDPQQLEQPQKGSHPEGVELGAPAHPRRRTDDAAGSRHLPAGDLAAGAEICAFTSEVFYESQLTSKARTRASAPRRRRRRSTAAACGSSPVDHDGNQNCVDRGSRRRRGSRRAPARAPGSTWIDEDGKTAQLTGRRHPASSRRTTRRSAAWRNVWRPLASASAPWTSSRARRRPSSSTRWPRRAPRTRRAAWSSCTASIA